MSGEENVVKVTSQDIRKIRDKIENLILEVEEGSEKLAPNRKKNEKPTKVLTLEFYTGHYDRWEYMLSWVFLQRHKHHRLLHAAREEHQDSLRSQKAKGLKAHEGGLGAYAEREAIYETRAIDTLKTLRLLEGLEEETREFARYLERKLRWVEEKRRELRREMDEYRFSSNKNYSS